jgi:hypothetical protein
MNYREIITDRGNPNYAERNLPKFHFLHHKPQIYSPEIKPETPVSSS